LIPGPIPLLTSEVGGQRGYSPVHRGSVDIVLDDSDGERGDSYAGTVSEAVVNGADVSKAEMGKGITPIPAVLGSTMIDLIDRIREIIERHRVNDFTTATGHPCHCGAEELSDHSRHVAQEIVVRLGLRPERAINVKDEIRYVSAWFDDELTKLEGAE
jgi:hypothetical protein